MTPVKKKYQLVLSCDGEIRVEVHFESDEPTVMMALASFCQTAGYKEEIKNAPTKTEIKGPDMDVLRNQLLDLAHILCRGEREPDRPGPDASSWGGPYRDPDDPRTADCDPDDPDRM